MMHAALTWGVVLLVGGIALGSHFFTTSSRMTCMEKLCALSIMAGGVLIAFGVVATAAAVVLP